MRLFAAILLGIVTMSVAARPLGEPASWYGIVPGVSKEPNVIALYGVGRFEDKLGDTGCRTYQLTDGSTLMFIFGVDKIVERIRWEAARPHARKGRVVAEPREWFGWSPALVAGATQDRVIGWLGPPSESEVSDNEWTLVAFDSECSGAELRIKWREGSVTSLEMIAPSEE